MLADERIAPRAAEIDGRPSSRRTSSELLASHDILGLPFPVEYGGLGADLLTVCLAIEQISRACATTGLILAVQELASLPLLLAGTDEQKARWLPDLAAGETLVAFALTEAGGGLGRRRDSDPRPSATATTTSSTARSGSSARAASPTWSRSSP